MSLAEALERAATALDADAEAIRPANGDPARLLADLSAEAGARLLGWLLEHERGVAEELAMAWADDARGSGPIGRIDEAALPKDARKTLRRARHRLRSRGVEVSQPASAPVVARLPRLEDRLEGAFVSALDPLGARIVYLVESNPAGGVRLFELVLDELRGVVECEVYSANRSQARRFMRNLERRQQVSIVAAPETAVRALIARIAAVQPADRPLPPAFAESRSHLTRVPAGSPTPGGLARAELADEALPATLSRAVELVREGRIGPWPPSRERVEHAATQVRESGQSRLIVSKQQRTEQLGAALAEATDLLLAAADAERAARCFEEAAYVLWKLSQRADAVACLASANDLRQDEGRESVVGRALVERTLGPALEALDQEEREREKSSVLVKP